jgi:hypothetical protein
VLGKQQQISCILLKRTTRNYYVQSLISSEFHISISFSPLSVDIAVQKEKEINREERMHGNRDKREKKNPKFFISYNSSTIKRYYE